MRAVPFVTVDVFTTRRFGGNPLAVFPDAQGLSDAEMQALAAEMNLSETTFVLPPENPAHTARVRIFNRTSEMAFAGHPNVGTGWVLAREGRDRDGVLLFEEIAGLVEVRVERDPDGTVAGTRIAAPQPLSTGPAVPAALVAACAGLAEGDVLTGVHGPVLASVGHSFVIGEVEPAALARAVPDLAAFRRLVAAVPGLRPAQSLHLYARDGAGRLRARMFSPLAGTWEDPATGSANLALAGLLLSLEGGDHLALTVAQGVEMGRPSELRLEARRAPDGIRATVAGGCVPVLRGEALL